MVKSSSECCCSCGDPLERGVYYVERRRVCRDCYQLLVGEDVVVERSGFYGAFLLLVALVGLLAFVRLLILGVMP